MKLNATVMGQILVALLDRQMGRQTPIFHWLVCLLTHILIRDPIKSNVFDRSPSQKLSFIHSLNHSQFLRTHFNPKMNSVMLPTICNFEKRGPGSPKLIKNVLFATFVALHTHFKP